MNDDESNVNDVRCAGPNSCEVVNLPFLYFHRIPIHTSSSNEKCVLFPVFIYCLLLVLGLNW